jgi:hypothetical protein
VKSRKFWLRFIFVIAVIFIASELYLRLYWGFCDNVLMMADDRYEYIQQPGQDRFRFRNHVKFNSYSMRSEEPDSSAFIILGLGDSVIDGGVMVDQDSLATERLSRSLSKTFGFKIQVLNLGAGSWGPDNCYAYIKAHGNFGAKIAFLVASSHDAYDNMDFTPVIDKVDRYESKQYKSAVWELLVKYGLPRLKKNLKMDDIPPIAKSPTFDTGFENLRNYFRERNIPFFVYLHPDQQELKQKMFNPMGKKIIDYCDSAGVKLVKEPFVNLQENDYRGVIHLNDQGQGKMANDIYPVLDSIIRNASSTHE